MHILAIGHNHDTAPVEIRERFAFNPDRLADALSLAVRHPSVRESVILSTCNRNEIYSVVTDIESARSELTNFIHDFHDVDRGLVDHSLYALPQERAVEHLFSVASGVDSMVVGETQVVAQLKDAFGIARAGRAAGPILDRLFTSSFETGKKVRHRTRISEGSVSVSSCAVELAKKIFTDFSDKHTVLVGAGENSEQTARILRDHGARKFVVVNRTVERAAALADRLGGFGIPLERIDDALATADIVITSTSSPATILSATGIRSLMSNRRGRPLLIIDLSVPRDVEPAARDVGNVFVYDVDDLSAIADENRERRRDEVRMAREIITGDVSRFMSWYRALDAAPAIVSVREHFESVRIAEIEKARDRMDEKTLAEFDAATRSLVNKLLHRPTTELKKSTDRGDDTWLALAMRRLFGLDPEDRDE